MNIGLNLKKRECENRFYRGFIVKIEKCSLKNSGKKLNLKKDPHDLAENFIKNSLEHRDKDYVIRDGVTLYPSCFANRCVREIMDNSYGFNNETGVYGNDFFYL